MIQASGNYTSTNKEIPHVTPTVDDLKAGKYVFEYLHQVQCTRFYADFDLKVEVSDSVFDALRAHANLSFRNLCNRKKGYVYTDGSYRIQDKKKLSFHIINRDIQIHKPSFTWKSPYGEMMKKELLEAFVDEMTVDGTRVQPYSLFASGLDDEVYGNKVCFRLPYGTLTGQVDPRNDKPYPHTPMIDTGDISDYFVSIASGEKHPMVIGMALAYSMEQNKKKEIKEEKEMKREMQGDGDDEPISDERKEKMIELLAMVKKERFCGYGEWRKLLCLIKGNELPRQLFLEISEESGYKNYSEESCLEEWFKLPKERTCGFPTIHKWLDEDGVNWRTTTAKEGMIPDLLRSYHDCGELTDKAVADIFYKYYNTSLYFTPCGWLHYNEKRGWEVGDSTSIIHPLMKFVGDSLIEYIKLMKPRPDEEDKDFKKRKLMLQKQGNRMCTQAVCAAIIKTAQTLFKNDNILEEFDAKPYWFCFSDFKAIDMRTGEVVAIKKEDKIITTCGYPLPVRDDLMIADAKAFIETLVEPEHYDSYMSMLSCNFYGDPNKNQKVFIHTGSGGNGKSLVGLLLQKTLSNYAGVLPIDQLTKDSKGRDDANSSLAAMRGKRYAQFNEPEDCKETKLKIARVKELSGEDKVMVRHLHKDAFAMTISFTMNIFCNEKPKMSKSDGGIERRLAVFPYVYSFVDEPDEEDAYQKQKDDSLGEKMKYDVAFRHGFLYLCLDHWRKTKGVFICGNNVKEANKEYMLENNPLSEWFTSRYEASDKYIFSKDMHKEYVATTNNELSVISFNRFLKQLGVKVVTDKAQGTKVFVQKK